MKKLPLLLILSLTLVANELEWVDQQIDAIKPARNGISKTSINAVKNPFLFLDKTKKDIKDKASSTIKKRASSTAPKKYARNKQNVVIKHATNLRLDAIINKSALINGKWYKSNEKVGKYTLNILSTKSVLLSYKKKELLLSTAARNKNLKFRNN